MVWQQKITKLLLFYDLLIAGRLIKGQKRKNPASYGVLDGKGTLSLQGAACLKTG